MAQGWRKNAHFDRPEFGRLLGEARLSLGLSFGDLSRLTDGVHRSTFKHVENGDRDLPETSVKPYCSRLINALASEAKRQGKPFDALSLWRAAGLDPSLEISRRDLLRQSAAAATAAILVVGSSGHVPEEIGGEFPARFLPGRVDGESHARSPREAYEALMAEGDRLSNHQSYAAADQQYVQAWHLAEAANLHEATSMALARYAYSQRRQSHYQQAWKLSTRALLSLDASDLAPERGIPSQEIRARGMSDSWFQAYAMIARVRGHIAHDLEQFGVAHAAFTTLGNIGDALEDPALRSQYRAHQEFFAGRLLIAEGTDIGDYEAYRRVTDAARVESGIQRITRAMQLRLDADPLWQGHALYQQLDALWLLHGETSASSRIEAAALEAFADRPAVANLYLSKGRLAVETGDETAASEHLDRALTLGREIGSADIVSGALGTLAELYAQSWTQSSTWQAQEAIAYCLGALGTWPSSIQTRGFQRLAQLFRDLGISSQHVRYALDVGNGPLEPLAADSAFVGRLRFHAGLLGVRV